MCFRMLVDIKCTSFKHNEKELKHDDLKHTIIYTVGFMLLKYRCISIN